MDCHGSVDVRLCGRQKDEIFVGNGDVGDSVEMQDGIVSVLLGGNNLGAVVEDLISSDVILEGSVDQDFSLDIDKDDRTNHFLN